jgi:apolipoprotein N-acyltransferase
MNQTCTKSGSCAICARATNDWPQVARDHLENSLFRSVENDYGVVRATSNGTSVIVSPRGRVLALRDHFAEGPGTIVATMPLDGRGVTPYAALGAFVPILWLAVLGGAVAVATRGRRRAPRR